MSEELRSQLSAFADNELAAEESELLVRRLCRDESLRKTVASYALIGDAMRGDALMAPDEFSTRIMMAVEGQEIPAPAKPARSRRQSQRTWGVAVAASVVLATVALLTLPERDPATPPALVANSPVVNDSDPATTRVADVGSNVITLMPSMDGVAPASFNVPMVIPVDRHSAKNRARLNKYLLRHMNTTSNSPNGVAAFRNVGFVQTEADR